MSDGLECSIKLDWVQLGSKLNAIELDLFDCGRLSLIKFDYQLQFRQVVSSGVRGKQNHELN